MINRTWNLPMTPQIFHQSLTSVFTVDILEANGQVVRGLRCIECSLSLTPIPNTIPTSSATLSEAQPTSIICWLFPWWMMPQFTCVLLLGDRWLLRKHKRSTTDEQGLDLRMKLPQTTHSPSIQPKQKRTSVEKWRPTPETIYPWDLRAVSIKEWHLSYHPYSASDVIMTPDCCPSNNANACRLTHARVLMALAGYMATEIRQGKHWNIVGYKSLIKPKHCWWFYRNMCITPVW